MKSFITPYPKNSSKLHIEKTRVLTTSKAGDSQSLGRVQGQAILAVLDVSHGGHGVEVGLQR